jgi:hypothetical protein
MRRLLLFLTALLLIVAGIAPATATAKSLYQSEEELKTEVRRQFEEILELWRDGNYTALYRRTTGGRESKEAFAKRLAEAPRKPACCWEKLQDPEVAIVSDTMATIYGKVGLEGTDSTAHQTRTFTLTRNGDTWQASRSDILSLSGAAKKKRSSPTRKSAHR